ncbi:ATP-dependent nuclease [Sphingomonas sp. Leaf32]|uniref:ATP-dependent nuclease n=2 Tax=Sphingomonas TaxID=13687 RepID=UPI000A3E33D1|nr:AAA family ATPase [Sphingomonas sp. Leaf32]
MIEDIELNFGSSLGEQPLRFEPKSLTVVIGPNNSGKSKMISEIAHQCMNGTMVPSDVIIKSIKFKEFDYHAVQILLDSLEVRAPAGQSLYSGHMFVNQRGSVSQVSKIMLENALRNPNDFTHRHYFAAAYSGVRTKTLDGKNRISLADPQAGGDLQQPAVSTFQHLFKDDNLRKKYRQLVYKSLGGYAVIDPTKLGTLRLRLSPTEPESADLERGLGNASLKFHSNAQLVEEASDGAKAFTGVLSEILAGNPEILLMDEPEAFLHPALAFNMGREISRSLASSNKQMFVSTHSAQFLMGCIQSGVQMNVIRLTYREGVATARLLPSEEIKKLMRNPLLRSTGVISALFYESVVVTEGDADRAFYQEINERLQAIGAGIPNCIFINAQNKQTIPLIIKPLRSLGIPAAAIYDLDVIKEGGGVATRFFDAAEIPELQQASLNMLRLSVLGALSSSDSNWKINGGTEVLSGSDKIAADNYFDQIEKYGAFVVRRGELEKWLPSVHNGGHGPTWLIPMFEAMGEDPDALNYVKPEDNDVWKFMNDIASWLLDSCRQGIPN